MPNIPVEFTINVTGESTGEQFRGLFKVKPRLSHRDTLMQDQMRRDLLGAKPESAGQGATASALVFSKIWAHLVEAPSWWKEAGNGVDLIDEAPVVAVYDGIQKAEQAEIDKVKKAAEKAVEDLAPEKAKKK